jgi:hypothetical protein
VTGQTVATPAQPLPSNHTFPQKKQKKPKKVKQQAAPPAQPPDSKQPQP